jgi:hypothetical protein
MAQPTLDQLKREIEQLKRDLGGKAGLDVVNITTLDQADTIVRGLRQELREMSGDLDYISKSFRDSVDELSKQNTYLGLARKSLTGVADISKKLVDYRRGENSITDKQLKNLKDQARVNFENLDAAIKSGKLSGTALTEAQESLDKQVLFNKAIDRTVEVQKAVNKQVGLLGVGLEGAGKFLEKMGFGGLAKPLSEAIEKTKEARRQIMFNNDAIADGTEQYRQNVEEIRTLVSLGRPLTAAESERRKSLLEANRLLRDNEKVLKAQNQDLSTQTNKYKNILSSLKEQFTVTNLIDASVKKIVEGFFEVNKAAVDYQRLSGQNAVILAGQNSSLATSAQVLTLMGDLTKQMGLSAGSIFSGEDLGRMAEAQNLLGLSAEEAGKLGLQSKLTNTSIEDYEKNIVGSVNTFNKLNGTAVSHGIVMQDVLSTSEDITLAMGNSSVEITKAAVAARGLGLNLERVDQIAGTLMNFEDSIGAELEAQLLTGKNINLSKARELAMSNDLAGLSEELKKNGATAAEYAGMNRIQQEALAKSLGMSRQELAKSIMTQEASKNLTDDQRAAAMGVTVEQMRQMDIQQKMETALSKLAQAFAPILDALIPIADMLIGVITPIAGIVGGLVGGIAPFIKYLTVGYGILKGMQITMTGISAIQAVITAAKATELGTLGGILTAMGLQNAFGAFRLAQETEMGFLAGARAVMEETTLGTMLLQGGAMIKNIAVGAVRLAQSLATAAAELMGVSAMTLGIGTAIAVGAAVAGFAVLKSMKDGVIDPNKGPVVSGEFGSVQLDKNDQVVAGTDLYRDRKKEPTGTISQASVDMSPVVSELAALRTEMSSIMNKILAKESTVYMDSNKVGRTQVLGSYKSA